MKKYSRLRAVIDLDAVMYNMEMMHANIEKGTKMVVVIKTDGYGHGAVPISRMLEDVDYVWGYAVATLDEGVVLRKAGIQKPILCLGCIFPDQMEEMIRHEIRMTTYSYELAKLADETAYRMGKKAYLHIKIDTGMSRLGFPVAKESVEEILKIGRLVYTDCEGMFTHFSKADETDKTTTLEQIRAFLWMKEHLAAEGMEFTYYHCANSAAVIDMPQVDLDMVRLGIAMYGMYPSDEVKKEKVELFPALDLKSHITMVKEIPAGEKVSYGGTFTTTRTTKLATVSVGYGDGYPRALSSKGYVLVRGQKAPIVGRVCMDQMMVDVTDIENVTRADIVTLIGKDGDAEITVEEIAALAGTFNYEFVCDLGKRIPRSYYLNGEYIGTHDCFRENWNLKNL